eukprot:TRINITY_DN3596_c1_g1_i2.p2 TRINITY_DN3596_c1_g1~~TRINITY_DN3596_c1_g1_i2.p2  ORF type:complete len:224 (-),score=-23.51 TRINITY_DN3596_c1_g1_i2:414-1085(-)
MQEQCNCNKTQNKRKQNKQIFLHVYSNSSYFYRYLKHVSRKQQKATSPHFRILLAIFFFTFQNILIANFLHRFKSSYNEKKRASIFIFQKGQQFSLYKYLCNVSNHLTMKKTSQYFSNGTIIFSLKIFTEFYRKRLDTSKTCSNVTQKNSTTQFQRLTFQTTIFIKQLSIGLCKYSIHTTYIFSYYTDISTILLLHQQKYQPRKRQISKDEIQNFHLVINAKC